MRPCRGCRVRKAQCLVLSDGVQAQEPLGCPPGRNRAQLFVHSLNSSWLRDWLLGKAVPKGTDSDPMLCWLCWCRVIRDEPGFISSDTGQGQQYICDGSVSVSALG